MISLLRAMHDNAKIEASYERYMQDTVHNWQDEYPQPRWMRLLWRFYIVHLLANLRYVLAEYTVCRLRGHDMEDTGSWAGPDSGGEDMTCKRCGYHFHHTYY